MQSSGHANHLIQETSPYLKQHAHNPVDWYPWGQEALGRARELDRPIFLSIGYSACHWCHVMEHESFEDAEVGNILNENFVPIKVDREERPDLDQIYMIAVQMMTGQGGWPMSVFLTPDLKPFFGGTYFPPVDNYGRPSFKSILHSIVEAWKTRRDKIDEAAGDLTGKLHLVGRLEPSTDELKPSLLQNAALHLSRAFDSKSGGFGSAPKFPHPIDLRLLLRAWKRFGDENALHMVRLTLDRMAMGGMYDHLGGGFHRYSTDQEWLVPHFEKMLYDNALLTVAYLEAYQATNNPLYRDVVEETLQYALREMTSPEGPFYSTQDADSEGEEGKFFVWSAQEIEEVLGKDLANFFTYVYDVTEQGNWEGRNILNQLKTYDQYAKLLGVPESELRQRLSEAKTKLLAKRNQRVHPGRDEKILTAWNGLMIGAFAQSAAVLRCSHYAETAAKAADFILQRMRRPDGQLWRTVFLTLRVRDPHAEREDYGAGSDPKLNAYLEDYAFFIDGLISLYEATFEPRWIKAALDLTEVMIDQFWDSAQGGFFYTGRDHEQLIARTKDPHDSSVPSGNSMAVTAMLRLAKLTGRLDLLEKSKATLQLFHKLMASSPSAASQMLLALDFFIGPVDEFAVVGEGEASDTQRVLATINGAFRPLKVVALTSGSSDSKQADEMLPLLAGKPASGVVTTYICRDFTCREPIVGCDALEKALERV